MTRNNNDFKFGSDKSLYFYHVTAPENVDSIVKNGLRPDHEGDVWLANTAHGAIDGACMSGRPHAVLKVAVNPSNLGFKQPMGEYFGRGHSVRHMGTISPDQISVVTPNQSLTNEDKYNFHSNKSEIQKKKSKVVTRGYLKQKSQQNLQKFAIDSTSSSYGNISKAE